MRRNIPPTEGNISIYQKSILLEDKFESFSLDEFPLSLWEWHTWSEAKASEEKTFLAAPRKKNEKAERKLSVSAKLLYSNPLPFPSPSTSERKLSFEKGKNVIYVIGISHSPPSFHPSIHISLSLPFSCLPPRFLATNLHHAAVVRRVVDGRDFVDGWNIIIEIVLVLFFCVCGGACSQNILLCVAI